MKRPVTLLAALLCLMPGAYAASAQSADEATSVQSPPEDERALHDRRVAAGQIIERLPGESQSAFAERARAAFAQRPQYTGQPLSSSTSAHPWPEPASSSYSPATTRPSSRSSSGFGMFMIFVFALVFFGVRKIYRGVFGLARIVSANTLREDQPPRELDHMFFDQHVAKRLAELQAGEPTGEAAKAGPSHHTVPPMPAPVAVRGFGRKV
jgi:hypothetical protein